MTMPENARLLRTNELPPVGTRVYVPENTPALAGLQPTPGWRTVRATNSDNSTIAVKDTDGYTSWVLSHNLLVADETCRRLTVGDRVRINDPKEPMHGQVGVIIQDDKTNMPYFVKFETAGAEWFYAHQVDHVSTPEGTFPGEMDTPTTTTPTTITTTTHVTLPRPATAKQVADALTHVDGHHEVTVHTYPDRIEIEAHHEETQSRR